MAKQWRGAGGVQAVSASPSANQDIPPILHAVGGSLGSALALLLFFPLERARIEMQSSAAEATCRQEENENVEQEEENNVSLNVQSSSSVNLTEERVISDPEIFRQPSEGPPTAHGEKEADSPTNESWVQFSLGNDQEGSQKRQEDENMDTSSDVGSSWSISSTSSFEVPPSSRKSALVSCLVGLHERSELYRGVSPVITTMAASNFVFFYAHEVVKRYVNSPRTGGTAPRSLTKSLLASSLAGIANVLVTNPLWVANLRIVQGETNASSLWTEMKNIIRNEGVSHLWNGTLASLLLVSNPVIQFFCYEQLKARRFSHRQMHSHGIPTATSKISPVEAFLLGAVAKGLATVVTYPLQLAQVLLRLQHKRKQQQQDTSSQEAVAYTGTMDCFRKLYKQGGVPALYKGMDAKLLQTVLTAAFTFLTYEQILRLVRASYLVLSKRRQSILPAANQ